MVPLDPTPQSESTVYRRIIALGLFVDGDEVLIIYQCSLPARPEILISNDPEEVGPKGIQWLTLTDLSPEICSSHSWEALQCLGRV